MPSLGASKSNSRVVISFVFWAIIGAAVGEPLGIHVAIAGEDAITVSWCVASGVKCVLNGEGVSLINVPERSKLPCLRPTGLKSAQRPTFRLCATAKTRNPWTLRARRVKRARTWQARLCTTT